MKVWLKFIIAVVTTFGAVIIFQLYSRNQMNNHKDSYWTSIIGTYSGRVIDAKRIYEYKYWAVVAMETSEQYTVKPYSSPFFLCSENGIGIFLDNGELKGDGEYVIGDSVHIEITKSGRFLQCYDDQGELKFSKNGLPLYDFNKGQKMFQELAAKHNIDCVVDR